MSDSLQGIEWVTRLISAGILLPFGLYSLIYFPFRRLFVRRSVVYAFDQSAVDLTLASATLWVTLKIIYSFTFLGHMYNPEETDVFWQHARWMLLNAGPQLVLWLFLSQALRLRGIRRRLLPRLLVVFFLIFSIDLLWILLTHAQREHLSLADSLGLHAFYFLGIPWILAQLISLLWFVLATLAFHVVRKRLGY